MEPPKTNRITYSYQCDCPIPDVSISILTRLASERHTRGRKRKETIT
jgi:hypothetical protein